MLRPFPTKRRGPLVLEDGVERIYVECRADAGGCGRTCSFYRDRVYLPAARRAFRHHARQCPCVPSRWPRWLTITAFVLALAAVAFAATVAGLSSLAVPAPATPTTVTAPSGYVPVPAGPPARSKTGGGR
jgi:hypothetical protein